MAERSWRRRVLWLVGLWTASVLGLALLAWLLRLLMNAAGLSVP
jgi:hypothetical protein